MFPIPGNWQMTGDVQGASEICINPGNVGERNEKSIAGTKKQRTKALEMQTVKLIFKDQSLYCETKTANEALETAKQIIKQKKLKRQG